MLASEIIGGPSSFTYDWPVGPADICILDFRQNVLLTSCGLEVPCQIHVKSTNGEKVGVSEIHQILTIHSSGTWNMLCKKTKQL